MQFRRVNVGSEIQKVLHGKPSSEPPELLLGWLAGRLGASYEAPETRKHAKRVKYAGDSAAWCERLYRLPAL